MLDQRRAEERGYITLKEAAKISNYTPDYIGQLIRAGRIRGEQVYSNLAWVTTEEEVMAYMTDKSRTVNSNVSPELVITKNERILRAALYGVIALFVCVLLIMQYIFYVAFDDFIGQQLTTSVVSQEAT